jgi:hypothetical protein
MAGPASASVDGRPAWRSMRTTLAPIVAAADVL